MTLVAIGLVSCAEPSTAPLVIEEASPSFPIGNAREISAAQAELLAIRSHSDVPPGSRGEDLFDGTAVDVVTEHPGTTKIWFRVDEVFEGCRGVGNIVVVRSARPESGGVEIEKGGQYRVFAVDLEGVRWTWALTGTVRRPTPAPAVGETARPLVSSDRVRFANGTEIRLGRIPGDSCSGATHSILLEGWRRVAIVESKCVAEGDVSVLRMLSYSGEALGSPLVFSGEAFFLDRARRIFVGQHSAHDRVIESLVLDPDGVILRRVPQPENTTHFEVSDDEEVVWRLSQHIADDRRPFTRATALTPDGEILGSQDLFEAGDAAVVRSGKSYSIHVATPEPPG